MDIGKALGESFEYAVEAVWGKWVRWVLLVVCSIIFPLMTGYQMQVYRGIKPAPEPTDWVKLLIDGIKLIIVTLIYLIPFFVVFFVTVGSAIFVAMTQGPQYVAGMLGRVAGGMAISVIVLIITLLILIIAEVRFARTGRFGEAFNFGAILGHIGKIGWGGYLLALIVFVIAIIVLGGILVLFSMIPLIGWLIQLFLGVPVALFGARYITLLYDSAGPAAAPSPAV
jgi:hypothetical protein